MRATQAFSILLVCLGLLTGAVADNVGSSRFALDWTPAQRIIIEKSRRRLTLVRADNVVRVFEVALGAAPIGPKRQAGDSRTPEGAYVVDFKNLYSNYYLSVRLSYPNDRDVAEARALGVDPGGNIMIHGMPNGAAWPYRGYAGHDWTDGCIAVSNAAMQEIWLAVRESTPVEIRP